MAATLKDILISPLTYDLLKENGKMDCNAGTDMHTGWREVAKECGYSEGRTPAREAYEDGYYSGTFGSTKKTTEG